MINYSKSKFLHAEVDICVPREQFYKDINEAFDEIDKWRENKDYSPKGTIKKTPFPSKDDEEGRSFSEESDQIRQSLLDGLTLADENRGRGIWSWLLHRYSIGEISQR